MEKGNHAGVSRRTEKRHNNPIFYYFNRFHPHEQLLVEQLARPCSEPSFSTQANINSFTNTTNHHVYSNVYRLNSDDSQFHPILNLD
jgi:hypothetical protein